MKPGRRAVAGCVAAALVWLSPGIALAAARDDPAKTVSMEKRRLDAARAAVAQAEAQLSASAAAARAAIDRYDRVMHRLRAAQVAADDARVALAMAVSDVARTQEQVNSFARASYMSGGPLAPVAALLSAGGPGAILDQASLLGAVSQSQADMLRGI
jgi:hypothetical protein